MTVMSVPLFCVCNVWMLRESKRARVDSNAGVGDGGGVVVVSEGHMGWFQVLCLMQLT